MGLVRETMGLVRENYFRNVSLFFQIFLNISFLFIYFLFYFFLLFNMFFFLFMFMPPDSFFILAPGRSRALL